jgi:hypothetical protein
MSEQETDFLDEVVMEEGESPEVAETAPEPVAETAEIQPEATAAPEVREEHHVPYAAMKAEREKRQQAERRAAEYEQYIQSLQQPQVDFYQQPDVYVQQHLQSVEARTTQRFHAALAEQAREVYPDFDEVVSDVVEHASENPMIEQKVMSAANPALAAYRLGKQLREMKQMQDPATYRQRIEAEVRAQVEAEFRNKEAQRARAAAAIPPDLTDTRNARGSELPAPETVFDDIFPRN